MSTSKEADSGSVHTGSRSGEAAAAPVAQHSSGHTGHRTAPLAPPGADRNAPSRRAGLVWAIIIISGLALVGVLFAYGVRYALTEIKSSYVYTEAVRLLRADERVSATLGAPIEPGWYVIGSFEIKGESGKADFSIPLHGAMMDGTAYVLAEKEAGTWSIKGLSVGVDATGERIPIILPEDLLSRWDNLMRAGATAYGEGNYPDAEEKTREALEEAETYGADDPRVAATLNVLAELQRRKGAFEDAVSMHERALAIREKALGADHPSVAVSLNNLAMTYQHQGRYPEAENLLERAIAIDENVYGPNHPEVATDLNNLARLHGAQGRFAEAEPLHGRALSILEKALGPDHPDVAESLYGLAWSQHMQGRHAEAEPLMRRSAEIVEAKAGAEHPYMADVLEGHAAVLSMLDRDAEAEALKTRAAAIRAKHAAE